MIGYRVGQVHPTGNSQSTVDLRQFTDLSPGESSDLAESLIRSLESELVRLGVAGAFQADRWELAERIRSVIREHHRAARKRSVSRA